MVRIYRYFLVVVLILLISWGVWYVVSNYDKESDYEDGVLVRIEEWHDGKESESWRCGKEITYGTGYSIH